MADGSSMSDRVNDREVEAVARALWLDAEARFAHGEKGEGRNYRTIAWRDADIYDRAEYVDRAEKAIAALDAVRRSPQDEDHGPLSRDFPHSLPNNPSPRGEDHEDDEWQFTTEPSSPNCPMCGKPWGAPSPERDTERLVEALQQILDMGCPLGREGDLLGEAQKIASETITRLDAQSPRAEDHEAGIEAVVIQAINDYTPRDRPWREWKECVARRAAILLSRVSPSPERDTEKRDDQIGRIVRFLVDAGYEAAAATVEIEFGCPPSE